MAKVKRLADEIMPSRYDLVFKIDMEKFRYTAKETVSFTNKTAGKELAFHASGLEIKTAEMDGRRPETISEDKDSQTMTFVFDEAVAAGEHILRLEFVGQIQDSLHGFYKSEYVDNGVKKYLATTQFEAVHAREAFICIDEPLAKAVFSLALDVPAELDAISNTNVTNIDETVDRKLVQFAPSPKMSTYLVAMMVGDFEYVEGKTKNGVDVRVYATPGKIDQLGFAVETGVRALEFYEEYFGIPYPLPKLDMISIPDFAAGAMENWGAVTYRETALLLDPKNTSLANKQRVCEVITHELAHQWFGNLVTLNWWQDLWLNEGFASWMEAFAKDKLFPDWQVWTEFVSSDVSRAMEMDSLANTHPIEVEVEDPRSLDEIFDAISYAKGSSIINMLHHYLGAENFRKGLHDYLTAHSYANAVTHDLWKALGTASGKPVDEVMSAWTSVPGYPIVSFEDGETKQTRFYASPRQRKIAANKEIWPIPFGAIVDGRETQQALITKKSQGADPEIVASNWFKPNPGQTGFYRSLYTGPMIKALEQPLIKGELSASDRFGIVDDVFAETEAGLTRSDVALELTAALRHETNFVVWGGLASGFGSLSAIVEDKAMRDQLEAFGRWLIEPNLKRLGWDPKPGEPVFDTLMRPLVLQQAARFDHEDVVREAKRRLGDYINSANVDPNLRPAVFYAAARHGDEADFEAMLRQYRLETVPQVKIALLGSMGIFRQPEIIDAYLKLGLSNDVRHQDLMYVVAYGFRNRDGREKTWKWVQDNWGEFIARYGAGGHMLESFPLYAASGFATQEMADEIRKFFARNEHPAIKRPTAQAVESVELKADWYKRDQEAIKKFLDSRSNKG
jgi:puromycin-sensitive aminopeptidase